jgi:hypothetical protein
MTIGKGNIGARLYFATQVSLGPDDLLGKEKSALFAFFQD